MGRAVIAALLGVVVLSCGDDPVDPDPGPDPSPVVLAVTPDSLRFESLEDTLAITVSVDGGAATGFTLISRDPLIAAVVAGARVVSRTVGETWVVATLGESADSAAVVVTQVAVSLEGSAGVDTLAAGDSTALAVVARDARGHEIPGASAVWTSSDTLTVRVDASGQARGRLAGTATLEAALDAVRDSIDLTVVPGPAKVLQVEPSTLLILIGDEKQLDWSAADSFDNAVPATDVQWTSRAPAVTSLGEGRVRGAEEGESWIVAQSAALADSVLIRVLRPAARLEVLPAQDTLNALGDTLALVATAYDASDHPAPGHPIEWVALDPAVATVDDSGRVVSVTPGTARIRVGLLALADTALVISRQVPAAIDLAPDTAALAPAEVITVVAVVADSNGAAMPDTGLVWISTDPTHAVTDPQGAVTALDLVGAWIRATVGEAADSMFAARAPAGGLRRTWVGSHPAGPTDIRIPNNWWYGGAPGIQDTVSALAGRADYPLLQAARQVARIEVAAGAVFDVAGFDLTVTHSVDAPGTFVGTTGRLVLGFTSGQPSVRLAGFTPRLLVPSGRVGLVQTGSLWVRHQIVVDGGRLQSDGQLIQVDNQ